MTVRYPQARKELILNLRNLGDPEYQERVWVQLIAPPNYVDSFTEMIHFFFDDSEYFNDPIRCIGFTLKNEEEAEAVRAVTTLLDELLEKYGTRLSDEEYISKPEWSKIVEAARAASEIIVDDD